MCGFVAVVSTEGRGSTELTTRMRDALAHRGPDEAGVWVSPGGAVSLGTRRLRIIDLHHGQQPLRSRDGHGVIAYNGEVYNHAALREALQLEGHAFATRCDTEAVLVAYERYGDDCLRHLDGMFAFAIWDERRDRLFFARDRVGKKPLYYARTRDGWAFASEIKALLLHPDIGRGVDHRALAHYLSFLATPAPDTLFAGIHKLPAGHCGSWSRAEGLSVRRWWQLPAEPLELDDQEAEEQVRGLLTGAVEKRMMSDVPFGVYLSGGIDSTANVALMSRYTDEPLRTFSVAFESEPSIDELAHARRVADLFGTDHHEIVVSDSDVIASLPDLIHHQDEPIADPVCVPLLHLARLTKASGVTVVQVGEGGDEVFFGYPAYARVLSGAHRLRRVQRVVPRRLLSAGVSLLSSRLDGLKFEFMESSVRRGIPPAHALSGFSERDKRELLASPNSRVPALEYLAAEFGAARTDEEIARVTLAHELQLRLPELLLMRVDKMTMAASVEARAPYLDHALIELVSRLPLRLRWSEGNGKVILRRVLQGIVPPFVLERPKQGFGAPVWRWSTSLRSIAQRELLRDPVLEFFDATAVRALLDRRPSTRQGFELWTLLNFALWHRHHIEGQDLREQPSPAVGASS